MTLEEMKQLVLTGSYDYSAKVRGLMEDGWYSEKDLEVCICTATNIYKKEKDEFGTAADGYKHVILGRDSHGYPFYTCGKVIKDDAGKLYFFITAHEAQ
jgi:hypothetical protein